MTTEPIKTTIPKGWNALYSPTEKKAYVYKEFATGGYTTGSLSVLNAETKELLDAKFVELGIPAIPITVEQVKPTK